MYTAAIILAGLLGLALSLIPAGAGAQIFSFFSFDDFGIRPIRRWNTTTDTLGNFFLLLSFLFCCTYIIVPAYEIIYSLWLVFTLLCALSRTYQCMKKEPVWKSFLTILMMYSIAAIGFLCVMGIFNDRIFVYPLYQMQADLTSGRELDVWYFLQNISVPYTVLQGFLMMIPLFTLWQQFKYMRLEGLVKGYSIYSFYLHTIFVDLFMIVLSKYGFILLNEVYQINYHEPPQL